MNISRSITTKGKDAYLDKNMFIDELCSLFEQNMYLRGTVSDIQRTSIKLMYLDGSERTLDINTALSILEKTLALALIASKYDVVPTLVFFFRTNANDQSISIVDVSSSYLGTIGSNAEYDFYCYLPARYVASVLERKGIISATNSEPLSETIQLQTGNVYESLALYEARKKANAEDAAPKKTRTRKAKAAAKADPYEVGNKLAERARKKSVRRAAKAADTVAAEKPSRIRKELDAAGEAPKKPRTRRPTPYNPSDEDKELWTKSMPQWKKDVSARKAARTRWRRNHSTLRDKLSQKAAASWKDPTVRNARIKAMQKYWRSAAGKKTIARMKMYRAAGGFKKATRTKKKK